MSLRYVIKWVRSLVNGSSPGTENEAELQKVTVPSFLATEPIP